MAGTKQQAKPKGQQTQPPAETNGHDPALAEAIAYEQQIAEEAAAIRGDAQELTPELYMKLWPLLRRPIPAGFIQTVPQTTGKPYDSTGIKSVQVCIDRMDNVLTPLWWRDEVEYENDGKLATVTVVVGGGGNLQAPLVKRSSRGGVERGSTTGNVYKGSYTNAAKLAFARVGPGHEVYLGATDFDPDVDPDAAEQAEREAGKEPATVGTDIAGKLIDRAWKIEAAKKNLQLAASHAAGRDVGDCSTKAKAVKALGSLTYPQGEQLERWIAKKEGGGDAEG